MGDYIISIKLGQHICLLVNPSDSGDVLEEE
jgi:hypothetical protein